MSNQAGSEKQVQREKEKEMLKNKQDEGKKMLIVSSPKLGARGVISPKADK